ncbi:hypothetical protein E6P09_17825 (plasmid) [Haloferax mediterranei ATCC 33500]|uniref:Uncharacterized protein n=1 Tax=Haloferax mediterranei (strain ATCC 33500 / DSM 1411 / JCM 8866 / NBRC 14739 / NCIMB 2177 / R-4) TaxID=523841 RepID=I3R9W1_HALMT|nr:hypothetical protein [Haloferax mediterranei]AFK21021.1 hypothetical protein HFX_5187 [Haloferax mediterranei ATCC 33500]AHZ24118.1 hypothetical protein BM92_18100 [Haloferax mediterranei ATCC 33500]EMA05193.1 hypothetical protein C439_00300 [Haloferax mediterranei ATCC 33500]MDX5990000.1 hypothetical protein [Haloferax mediterranei ATCC 33500]QCQ77182.1 hypothetical protein E6P09_17825 [Haloferax mediterranei ATCC 33500]
MLRNEPVQRVLREVGSPSVGTGKKLVSTFRGDDAQLTAYFFETAIGTLRYTEVKSHEVAHFVFGEDVRAGALPREYRLASEVESASVLSDMCGGTEFFRAPTKAERVQLQRRFGFDLDESTAFFSSAIDGFGVVPEDSKDATATLVEFDSFAFDSASTSDVTPMEECDTGACTVCMTSTLSSVGTCGWACYAVATPPPVSIAGAVACLTCVAATGVSLGYFCSECLETPVNKSAPHRFFHHATVFP